MSSSRIPEVDALRGFALLGVCMVNAPVIAGAWGVGMNPGTVTVDRVAAWLVTALFTTKFYLLFSFLLGYSFVLQMDRVDLVGSSLASRHGRRMLGMFVIGLVHAVLLYPGDVLMTYAILGLPLFAARQLTPPMALRVAGLLIAFLAVVFTVTGVLVLQLDDTGQAAARTVAAHDAEAYRGDFSSIVLANLAHYQQALGGAILYSGHLFAAQLAGFAAGRRGLLRRPVAAPTTKRTLLAGLVVGVPGGVLTAMCTNGPFDERFYYLGQAVDVITAPVLAATYGLGLLWLLRRPFGEALTAVLAPAGRMSMSNYLMQSLVLALVFTGYGLGLYNRVGPALLACGCLGLYAGQLAFSFWLMNRTRYGPTEVVLRWITNGPNRVGSGARSGDILT